MRSPLPAAVKKEAALLPQAAIQVEAGANHGGESCLTENTNITEAELEEHFFNLRWKLKTNPQMADDLEKPSHAIPKAWLEFATMATLRFAASPVAHGFGKLHAMPYSLWPHVPMSFSDPQQIPPSAADVAYGFGAERPKHYLVDFRLLEG